MNWLGDNVRRAVWLGRSPPKEYRRRPKVSSARTEIARKSAKAEGSLTERQTCRPDTKVGLSDPAVVSGNAVAQRTKVTLGITGLSPPRVHIDGEVWHLDVGSSHPGAEVRSKGWAVRPLKRYASWVQNVVRQFGPYLSQAQDIWRELSLVREDQDGHTDGVSVVTPVARLSS